MDLKNLLNVHTPLYIKHHNKSNVINRLDIMYNGYILFSCTNVTPVITCLPFNTCSTGV